MHPPVLALPPMHNLYHPPSTPPSPLPHTAGHRSARVHELADCGRLPAVAGSAHPTRDRDGRRSNQQGPCRPLGGPDLPRWSCGSRGTSVTCMPPEGPDLPLWCCSSRGSEAKTDQLYRPLLGPDLPAHLLRFHAPRCSSSVGCRTPGVLPRILQSNLAMTPASSWIGCLRPMAGWLSTDCLWSVQRNRQRCCTVCALPVQE